MMDDYPLNTEWHKGQGATTTMRAVTPHTTTTEVLVRIVNCPIGPRTIDFFFFSLYGFAIHASVQDPALADTLMSAAHPLF
jgi:hypothetical protein